MIRQMSFWAGLGMAGKGVCEHVVNVDACVGAGPVVGL